MTQLDDCRRLLTEIGTQTVATVPPGRARAALALLRAGDGAALADDPAPVARPGWNPALRLCLELRDDERGDPPADAAVLAAWAEQFLDACDQLALADVVLARCASGHLQLQRRDPRTFVAWATSRRPSAAQRERADFDWWSAHLTRQVAPRLAALRAERPHILARLGREDAPNPEPGKDRTGDPTAERHYRQIGAAHVARFACQLSYPGDATIGGATIGLYTDILAVLIGWLHRERDHRPSDADHTPAPWDERELIAALARTLAADPATVGSALRSLVLDRDNAAYHGTPGGAAPPLIRLDADRVVASAVGLLGEPLLFLARDLRRRHAQEYHNAAALREGVFRRDLYRLFADRRFATSAGRVELKRSGEARTDLDALVFDRKTGTLGVFELKAQDPFARSAEERQRQRDNFFHANRQVAAILEWVRRHGPDDLLARFDERGAKRFRVQKVQVFVLGRYLAHFDGGPEPDRRAAWGSWPQVLQAVGDIPFAPPAPNPLGPPLPRLAPPPPPPRRAPPPAEQSRSATSACGSTPPSPPCGRRKIARRSRPMSVTPSGSWSPPT